jgi:hypothetical protein
MSVFQSGTGRWYAAATSEQPSAILRLSGSLTAHVGFADGKTAPPDTSSPFAFNVLGPICRECRACQEEREAQRRPAVDFRDFGEERTSRLPSETFESLPQDSGRGQQVDSSWTPEAGLGRSRSL